MIPTRTESAEVLYPADDIVVVEWPDLKEMKRMALENPRKRIRLCAHRSPEDSLHEMFIIHTNETYVRPHKHIGKAESFAVLEGRVDVVLFHDDGNVRKVVEMGAPDSGLPFYYRLSDPVHHSLLIHSDFLVFHEVTEGPFSREKTVFADWAPESSGLNWLRTLVAPSKTTP